MRFFRKRRKKLGLALGGGAARGWAHIGVIHALREAEIPINFVAGTSIGALVGAFLAADKLKVLERLALNLDWLDVISFFDLVFPRSGLIDGKKVVAFLGKHLPQKNIEELPLPFAAVATDIISGKEVVLTKGNIIEAIRASIAVPGIFTPVHLNGYLLVDGGVLNPVPVNVVKEMGAEVVIAVDLNTSIITPAMRKVKQPKKDKDEAFSRFHLKKLKDKLKELPYLKKWTSEEPTPNIFDVILTSIYLMEQEITVYRLTIDKPDIVIRPQVGYIGFMDFHKAASGIAEGYRAAMEKIVQIKSYVRI